MESHVIVVTHRVFPETLEELRRLGRVRHPEVDDGMDPETLAGLAREADALMVFMPDRIDEALIVRCRRLKIVACALKGYDNIDVEACSRHGVWVSIVPDLLSAPTADLAVGLLLALTRNILEGDRFVRSGQFSGWRPCLYGAGLAGGTAGIVGFGGVGRLIAGRLRAFGMRLLCYDPVALDGGLLRGLGVEQVPFDELLQRSSVVMLTAPLSASSFHLFNAEVLGRMQPGSFLINVGRGSVVDEKAVVEALRNGPLAGYAAFELEDLSLSGRPASIPPSLLRDSARTVFTPHLGSAVAEVRLAIEKRAAANIADVLEGRPPRDAVNLP